MGCGLGLAKNAGLRKLKTQKRQYKSARQCCCWIIRRKVNKYDDDAAAAADRPGAVLPQTGKSSNVQQRRSPFITVIGADFLIEVPGQSSVES